MEESMETLSYLSSYIYLFGNDIRLLHLYTKGENFIEVHELLNELYDICFDYYDVFAEMAIAHDEIIPNPTDILLEDDIAWNPIVGDNFSSDDIKNYVLDKGNEIIKFADNITEYENFVTSKIDEFNYELDSLVNYKFARISD